MCKPTPAG